MSQWFYTLNGKNMGPASSNAVADLVLKDKLSLEDKVLSASGNIWQKVADIPVIMEIIHKPLAHPVIADVDAGTIQQMLAGDYDFERTQPLLYNISVKRLVISQIITLGLFQFYWFFKQWNCLRSESRGRKVSFFMASGFLILMAYIIFRGIEYHPELNKIRRSTFNAVSVTLVWYLLGIGVFFIPFLSVTWTGVFSSLLATVAITYFTLVPVQRYINECNVAAHRPLSSPSLGYWIVNAGSVGLWIFIIAIHFLSMYMDLGKWLLG